MSARGSDWVTEAYRLLHLDAHFGEFKEIYRDFDAEGTAGAIAAAGFQMVSFMAMDGPSYYPTRIGKAHPGLNRDFVGEFSRALRKRGIRCLVYLSFDLGFDSEKLDREGIPQLKEILENTPLLRRIGLWMLDQAHPRSARTIVCLDTPIRVEMFYNEREGERFVHLVNYCADKREFGTPSVQDFSAVHGIRIQVRLDDRPVSVTRVPGGEKVAHTYEDGWCTFAADPLIIHDVYMIEMQEEEGTACAESWDE